MSVRITPDQLQAIRTQAEASFPNECCGLLLGTIVNGAKILREIRPVANERESEAQRNRYLISSDERFRAERHARKMGLGVIGCYHSHPNAPARPSPFDRDHAPFPVESFIIVSVQQGRAEDITSWVLADDHSEFLREEIIEG